MGLSAEDVIAAYEAHGFTASASDIQSEIDNAERYGDDWANNQFEKNLIERDQPTASAGGSGGDIDLDGDGTVDPGWSLYATGGDPGWVPSGWQPSAEQGGYVIDAGGQNAGQLVAAYTASAAAGRAATESVRLEIDRLNLIGEGLSGEEIAGIRRSTGASILNASRAQLINALGLPMASSTSVLRGPASAPGTSTTQPVRSTSGAVLGLPGAAGRPVVASGSAGGAIAAPAGASGLLGGISPMMLIAIGVAAWVLWK